MSIVKVKYFDEIDTSGMKDYYDCEIDFNSTKIQLDLNFNPNQVIDEERIKLANEFLENLGSNNESVLKVLRQDFKEQGVTREYCDIILDTFEKDEIEQLIGKINKNYSKAKRLSLVLHPRRIGFYIDSDDEQLIVCDYTVDQEMTDELLVVFINANLEIDHITIES